MKRGGSMELDPTLWSELPSEMLERVLSPLPVQDLCRYRSVCKSWNFLIRSRKFGAIHAQSAAKRHASFIAMRCVLGQSHETHEGWCFLDLDSRRWFTVKDDHPKLHPRQSRGCSVAFIDGGLVCRYLKPIDPSAYPSNYTEAQRFSIIVYNPIAKTLKELPSVPCHLKSRSNYAAHVYPALNLVVDNISQRFKIFLINQHICASFAPSMEIQEDRFMRIYDSATNEWLGSTNPFCISTRGVGSISSTVVFQGFLYVLFGSNRGYLEGHVADIEREIWRYNIGEDAWEKVNVDIDARLCSIQLFANANRLFRIGWVDMSVWEIHQPERWRLEVSEIKIPGMVLKKRFEMSKEDAVHFFDEEHIPASHLEIVASGFGNSILLLSKSSQKMMVFDFETRLWDRLPSNPVWTQPGDAFYFDFECCFANPIAHMNLILPSSLCYQEGEGAADQEQVLLMKEEIEKAINRRYYHCIMC